MAANYFALPQFKVPGNAMVDFSPINNALEGMQQQQNLNRQRGDMLEQRDYQRGRDAKQDQRQDRADYRTEIDRFGKEAMAIDMMSDPGQRAAAHARLIARHPNRAELTPDYLDPIKGPKLIAAEAGQFRDPMEAKMKAAELQLKQAQANKFNREASEAGSQYGKQGTIIQDRNGNFYSVQFGANGQRKVEPLQTGGPDQAPVPLQPSRGVGEVDTGTGTQIIDKATGAPLRQVQKDIRGEAIAKGEGQDIAKTRAEMPEAKARLDLVTGSLSRLKQSVAAVRNSPGLDSVVGGLYQAYVPNVREASLNAETELENLKVKISGTVLQAMRDASKTGGAVGQVTEREWPRLENMIANLNPKQGKAQFLKNLAAVEAYADEVMRAIQAAYEADVAKARGGGQPAQPASAPPAASGGLPAGEYVWDGTQLVPKGR